YPGCAMAWSINPEGVASSVPRTVVNPKAWRRERTGRGGDATLSGLMALSMIEPRVARASQPWAEGCNPFGIDQDAQTSPHRCAMDVSAFGIQPSFVLRPSSFGLPSA